MSLNDISDYMKISKKQLIWLIVFFVIYPLVGIVLYTISQIDRKYLIDKDKKEDDLYIWMYILLLWLLIIIITLIDIDTVDFISYIIMLSSICISYLMDDK